MVSLTLTGWRDELAGQTGIYRLMMRESSSTRSAFSRLMASIMGERYRISYNKQSVHVSLAEGGGKKINNIYTDIHLLAWYGPSPAEAGVPQSTRVTC